MEFIGIICLLLFVSFLTYFQVRIFYYRHLKAYKEEIKEYLKKRNFEYIETYYPMKEDWLKSPFPKPPKI